MVYIYIYIICSPIKGDIIDVSLVFRYIQSVWLSQYCSQKALAAPTHVHSYVQDIRGSNPRPRIADKLSTLASRAVSGVKDGHV